MSSAGEALVLDFGGVISRTLFETHDLTEAALNLAPGTLSWRGPFAPETDAPWRAMQAGEITEREYWQRRMSETGALVGEAWTEFPEFVGRVRATDPAAVIRPEALDAIEAARLAGKRLAILSNELDLFYGADFRDKLPFMKDFDIVIDATYSKILKPDPRAYEMVTDALDLPFDACVFVDDQARNIAGAKAVGMQVVPFDVTDPARSYDRALELLGIAAGQPSRATG